MLNATISEAGIFRVALGAAMMGLRPIADVQYGDFLFCAMDQVANQIAKMRYISGGKLTVPLVMRPPWESRAGAPSTPAPFSPPMERFFVPDMKRITQAVRGNMEISEGNPYNTMANERRYASPFMMVHTEEAWVICTATTLSGKGWEAHHHSIAWRKSMPLKFRKVLIADERYEAAGVFDVDNDGILDIVSGSWWYQGPDFKRVHPVGTVEAVGEYFDDFSNIPMDVNGDGYMDYITGAWWGKTLRWRANPRTPDAEWPLHDIDACGCIERACAWDVDGDGREEIVPNCPGEPLAIYSLVTDGAGRGLGRFKKTVIWPEKQGHGLGCGDIAGNGRADFVFNNGWLEAPADPYTGKWTWHHEFTLFGSSSVPILVEDVNGDGVNDIIVGGGHEYGLDWWEQKKSDGRRTWIRHPIDPFNSQYHDMKWVDMDGDGKPELVTGKRYRAHNGRDPGERDDVGIYYNKWTGEGFAKQIIDIGPARCGKGVGIYFVVADLTGNGLPDVVAPGKDGLYVYYNEGVPS